MPLNIPGQSQEIQAKLVMLGKSGVGKSSIVLRFVKEKELSQEPIESTIGGKKNREIVYDVV
jgi:GTPase SAR1 family protein